MGFAVRQRKNTMGIIFFRINQALRFTNKVYYKIRDVYCVVGGNKSQFFLKHTN